MARQSTIRSVPRAVRRTKAFLLANLITWVCIGVWYAVQPPERQADVARLVRNAIDRRKEVSAFDVVRDLWDIYGNTGAVPAVAPGDRELVYGGSPITRAPVRVLANSGYVVGYNDALGVPLWVAYRVRDGEFGDVPPRPSEFTIDRRTSARIEPDDYTRSGFDRGHLAPSFIIALHYGRQAQEETFLMSNIAPQKHALNAGPWHALERRIARNYPARFGEVWVLVGSVLGEQPRKIHGRVAVPAEFFMIMVDEWEGRVRAEAFLFPQDAPEDASPERYLTSIDEIERRTGLDVLPELEDGAEATLEAQRATRMW